MVNQIDIIENGVYSTISSLSLRGSPRTTTTVTTSFVGTATYTHRITIQHQTTTAMFNSYNNSNYTSSDSPTNDLPPPLPPNANDTYNDGAHPHHEDVTASSSNNNDPYDASYTTTNDTHAYNNTTSSTSPKKSSPPPPTSANKSSSHNIKRKRKPCAYPNCTNKAVTGLFCRRHGERCGVEGCETAVYVRGRCKKHSGHESVV
eukprot:g4810.t1 g4810   contig17:95289-95900(-)